MLDWKGASQREIRRFCYTLGIIFCGIAAVNWALHHFLISRKAAVPWYIFAGIGIPVLIITTLNIRPVMRYIFIGWMTFARTMGWLITRLVLGSFFYIVLTPLGFILRLFGHDPLQLKENPSDSYWESRDPTPTKPEQYRKQY